MRATRAAVNGGNGLIYLFMAFGALMFFSYAVLILLGVALVVVVLIVIVQAVKGRQARRSRPVATQAELNAQQAAARAAAGTRRNQAQWSNRR